MARGNPITDEIPTPTPLGQTPSTETTFRLRRLGPRYQQAADALVEAALGRDDGVSARATWPLLLDHAERGERWVLTHGDTVVSHGALLLHDYVTEASVRDPSLIRVGVIGAMATTETQRGQGLATQLLDHLIERARSHRAYAVLLWSDEDRLYARAGFRQGGRELRVTVKPGLDVPGPGATRAASEKDLPDLRRLHDAEIARTLRDTITWRTHLGIPLSEAFVNERHGHIEAYAVIGKGLDLMGYAHELGGDDGALRQLLADVATAAGTDLPVLLPPWREDLARSLDAEMTAYPHAWMILNGPLDHLPYLTGLDSA